MVSVSIIPAPTTGEINLRRRFIRPLAVLMRA